MMDMDEWKITISVRTLVEFLYREGDIDNRNGGASEITMQEGSRMHRKLQKDAGEQYASEVPLLLETDDLVLEGRADGIYYGRIPESYAMSEGNFWTIDEIKTTYRNVGRIRKPKAVHLAQARCYAYMYAKDHDLKRVNVRMTYCNLASEKIRYFFEEWTMEDLSGWMDSLLHRYQKWLDYRKDWNKQRTDSIHALEFPYPYRSGQKELAAGVYRTIVHKRKLYLEAPTGTGKTITTLFPAIKAMGEGKTQRIFYLTAKTVLGTAAAGTLDLLRDHALKIKSVQLTAKDKICVMDRPQCDPDHCLRARGHYDRINDALYSLLVKTDTFDRDSIQRTAFEYNVCPFELSLDLSLFCDVIIADYNYVFDPHAYLRRFFGDGAGRTREMPVFLVDEAHNLVDRGRDMYSAALARQDLLQARTLFGELYSSISNPIMKCNTAMRRIESIYREGNLKGKWIGDAMILPDVDELSGDVQLLQDAMSEVLQQERIARQSGALAKDPLFREKEAVRPQFLDFYFSICHFNLILQKEDDHYTNYACLEEGGKFAVHLFCVDPSKCLRECMMRGRSTILFSATLLPITYYKPLLGGTGDDYEIYAHSVFDPEKQGIFLVQDVTSRYAQRSEGQYAKIAACIRAFTGQRHGNYMIFFPSYQFLLEETSYFKSLTGITDDQIETIHIEEEKKRAPQDVQLSLFETQATQQQEELLPSGVPLLPEALLTDVITENLPPVNGFGLTENRDVHLLLQTQHMSELEREAFLQRFENGRQDETLIGFCVLGGIFSEGIDLRRDSLIGVGIVGPGIPQIGTEREILKDYFDHHGRNGFDFAYRYPGMNKVLQAAGRVIRTQDDVGVVVLMDDRFVTRAYQKLYPREWKDLHPCSSGEIAGFVERFWGEWL